MTDPCTEPDSNPLACSEAQPAPRLTRLDEALGHILAAIDPIGDQERVNLKQATGRILAKDIAARHDIPPFPNSAMDGYALRVADLPQARVIGLRLSGASLAGHPYWGPCESGGCVRILTGAPVPEGTDAVVMQELCEHAGEGVVQINHVPRPGENIRRAGEDIQSGAEILAAVREEMTPAAQPASTPPAVATLAGVADLVMDFSAVRRWIDRETPPFVDRWADMQEGIEQHVARKHVGLLGGEVTQEPGQHHPTALVVVADDRLLSTARQRAGMLR